MDIQDLSFPSEEVAGARVDYVETPLALAQSPLTDRETAGFYRAMQEEREKRQALERRLAVVKTASESPPKSALERDLGVTVYANNLRVSRRFAEREYGRDVVSTVHDWAAAKCDSDPAFNARMRASEDPYGSCPGWWCSSEVAEPLATRALHMAP